MKISFVFLTISVSPGGLPGSLAVRRAPAATPTPALTLKPTERWGPNGRESRL
jgi:hypothetical protein